MTKIIIESNNNITIDGEITSDMKFKLLQYLAGNDTIIMNFHMLEDGSFDWIKNKNPTIAQCTLKGKLGNDIWNELMKHRIYLPGQYQIENYKNSGV